MDDERAKPIDARLDRRSVERVLARAAQLQTESGTESTSGDELITEAQLLDIGREVGLSDAALRRALAEERAGLPAPANAGFAARLSGPSHVHASRLLPGEPAVALAALDDWMQRGECLQVRRRFTDRMIWEARRDWLGHLQIGLNVGRRDYLLARAAIVTGAVTEVEPGQLLVQLVADVGGARSRRIVSAGTLTGAGFVAGGVLALAGMATSFAAALVAPIVAVPPILAGVSAYAMVRRHGVLVQRVHLALEQILDRMEQVTLRKPPSLLEALTGTRPLRS